jgi:hypothetical protein
MNHRKGWEYAMQAVADQDSQRAEDKHPLSSCHDASGFSRHLSGGITCSGFKYVFIPWSSVLAPFKARSRQELDEPSPDWLWFRRPVRSGMAGAPRDQTVRRRSPVSTARSPADPRFPS